MYTEPHVHVNKICSGEPKRKRFLAPRQIENYDIVYVYILRTRRRSRDLSPHPLSSSLHGG